MSFIDDNYLDGVITRITREHRDILLRTAQRLNLPDDDVLFLYIGAIEYTVQLCEDILGGISKERQAIEISADKARQDYYEQAKNQIETLLKVGKTLVADLQKSGMAATSAIAEANQEVLSQSKATVIESQSLKDQLIALRDNVDEDRVTFEDVLKSLLGRVGKTMAELDTAIKQINDSHTTIQKLQAKTKWLKWAEWLSPMTALIVVFLVGIGSGWWYMWQKYNESGEVLGRNIVQWNLERIIKCQKDNNSKCTLWIVLPPEKR